MRLNKTAFNLAWLHRDARAGYGEHSSLSRFACRRARTGNAYSHRRTNRWASHRRPYATHKGWYRLRISSGIGRRIGTVSWGNCTLKVASSIGSEAPANVGQWTRQLHRNLEANRTLISQVKPDAIIHRIRRLSRHFLPQYRRQIRVRNRMRRHHYLAFRSRPPKADDLSRNIKAKGWE